MSPVAITEDIACGTGLPLLIVAGPCVIESTALCIDVAGRLSEACVGLDLPFVFKSSFDKANRTSIASFRGPGLEEGLATLQRVKKQVGVPVLTDVHLPEQAEPVAEVADILQIPAFLSRQTDLLVAAARTGRPINIKKGQFMAPEDMGRAAEKVSSMGNDRIILCERGSCFGYHDLVVDMRSIPRMQSLGHPVLFDATHGVQQPSGSGGTSGGDRHLAPALAAGAVAVGADGLFMETHPEPRTALSDSSTMIPTAHMPDLLGRLKAIAAAAGRE